MRESDGCETAIIMQSTILTKTKKHDKKKSTNRKRGLATEAGIEEQRFETTLWGGGYSNKPLLNRGALSTNSSGGRGNSTGELSALLEALLVGGKELLLVVELGKSVDLGECNLGGGGDDVCLVHAAEGNAVQLEGTSDKEQATLELLQKHNALSAVSSREENQNRTRGDRLAQHGGLGSVPAGELHDGILSRVHGGLGSTSSLGGSLLCDHLLEAAGCLGAFGIELGPATGTVISRGARVELDAGYKLVAGHALGASGLVSLRLGSLGLSRLRSRGGSLLSGGGSLSRCSCYLRRHLQKPRNYGAQIGATTCWSKIRRPRSRHALPYNRSAAGAPEGGKHS